MACQIRETDIKALFDQIKELKANQKILREELRALKEDQVCIISLFLLFIFIILRYILFFLILVSFL